MAPHRFRLMAPPALGSVEFEAADPAALMTAALEARQQLVYHGYVLLQVWSEAAGAWCDPRYQNESRKVEIRAYSQPYLAGWEDRWRWCEDALRYYLAARPPTG
ncbi:MAG: hypothetical protein K2R93_12510 [Gemmatimonadaceae bacterium]|nr:hypothetical protein [Gemmatimonadaceae bacterium]